MRIPTLTTKFSSAAEGKDGYSYEICPSPIASGKYYIYYRGPNNWRYFSQNFDTREEAENDAKEWL